MDEFKDYKKKNWRNHFLRAVLFAYKNLNIILVFMM